MKKWLSRIACVVLAVGMLFGCTACGGDKEPKVYTIQYTDEQGTHQLEVTSGMPYSMEVIPEKTGYDFLGLFDAAEGGTQYVSAEGASLTPFKSKKNIVLFPQYSPKQYTVVLDYQGAAVTGSRELKATYGKALPELPKDLALENQKFCGWYTRENCSGVQIADEYGILPVVSVVNEKNFDISNKDGYLYLYAGFEMKTFTVTCHFGEGIASESLQVAYGTPISQLAITTRNNEGLAVFAWSKTEDGSQAFTGEITGDTILYATEWAPCINLDSNGGAKMAPIVARAGEAITLPTPKMDMATFVCWQDLSGATVNITEMPTQSTTLKAVWQGKLVFDENGGTEVEDISVAANEEITLPMPEKEGYIFAGWYTADKELYSSTTMPVSGVQLKAGWYKAKSEEVVLISSTGKNTGRLIKPSTSELCYTIKLPAELQGRDNVNIVFNAHLKIKTDDSSAQKIYVDFYSEKLVSSANLLTKKTIDNVTDSYKAYSFSVPLSVDGDFYLCWYMTRLYYSWSYFDLYLSDFYYTLDYPDTSNLYL